MLSLIFVGVQVRQSTRQAKADAMQAVHDNFSNLYLTVAANLDSADAAARGLKDPDALTDGETMSLISGLIAGMSYMQSAYFKWRQGDLSDELWHAWQNAQIANLTTPGGKRFWEGRKSNFHPDFVEYVEANLFDQTLPENFAPWLESKDDSEPESPEALQ